MKLAVLPKTQKGKWSVGLFILFILLAISGGLISSITEDSIEYPNPINSPLLGTVIYLMFAAAIIASITGLTAILKDKEKALLVYLSIPLGIIYFIVIIAFLIANILAC